jgi:uncharacterized membrane protein
VYRWIFERLYKNPLGRMTACALIGMLVAVDSVLGHKDVQFPLWTVAACGAAMGLFGGLLISACEWFARPAGYRETSERARFWIAAVLIMGFAVVAVVVVCFVATVYF